MLFSEVRIIITIITGNMSITILCIRHFYLTHAQLYAIVG